ncbi:MAG: agmatinase [Rhodobacteraceae bacterium]|nr:agmatinase [Paracoccaceae bacterium]
MALEDARNKVDTALTRGGFRGHSFENTFGGAVSFLRRSYAKDLSGVDLAVTGVPFDQAVTNRPGTRFGPRAIREASTLQAFDPPYGWDIDPMTDIAMADAGDMPFDYAAVSAFPAALLAHAEGILAQGAAMLTLGGDHYITLPLLQAHAAVHGPLGVIQFDAHSDTWADDDMSRIDHGTMMYKAIRLGFVDPARSVQVGIRTTNPDTMGVTTCDSRFVHEQGCAATVARIREVVGEGPVYLTFDIDALDPAYAPGTGTPVWGGLSSAQAAIILRDLAGVNMVGGDVVEVNPAYDATGATAVAGAHVAVELACLWAWGRRARGLLRR